MKTIGLIGGISPESTAIYYRLLNETAHERLGGAHSARLIPVAVPVLDTTRLHAAAASAFAFS